VATFSTTFCSADDLAAVTAGCPSSSTAGVPAPMRMSEFIDLDSDDEQ
jgi:hypothetical protein